MNGVQARGNGIQISYQMEGRQVREQLPLEPTAKNMKVAAAERGKRMYDIHTGVYNPRRLSISVEQLLRNYLSEHMEDWAPNTQSVYTSYIENHLIPAFGKISVCDLTPRHVKEWSDDHVASLSRQTRRNILIPLTQAMKVAIDDRLIKETPMPKERMKGKSRYKPAKPFSPSELKVLLAAAGGNPLFAAMLKLWAWTGLRTDELLSLRWGNVRLDEDVIRVVSSKTKAGVRSIPILKGAQQALQTLKPHSLTFGQFVCLNPRTNGPWTKASLRRAWLSLFTHVLRGRVAYRPPYQLRHTFASMMLSSGENEFTVAKVMGHADTRILHERYGRLLAEMALRQNEFGVKATERYEDV